MGLRGAARTDAGVAAHCLCSLLTIGSAPSDSNYAEAMAGAMLIADGLQELRNIRRLLTGEG